ncbi:hypothetical protein MKZ38_009472 [Zalerion maritima]|uniref:Replication protein A subunit n=1 Tax=Zalerion maritima TaxID=339359 RepID=A0AAD5WM27_9PEZI|nr:hypothetical protein MKZ38_009472 [Zalerion maritima]
MDDLPITQGALQDIFRDVSTADKRHPFPVFQCLQIKPLSGGPGTSERFRIVLSDINNYCQSMLATQANSVVKDDILKKGHLVRVTGYQANSVKGKNILVILSLDVLQEHGQREKIGEPVGLEAVPQAPTTAAAAAAPAVPKANASMSGAGFYGNQVKKEEASQANLGLPSRAPPSDRHGGNVIYPIEALSPYSHKWTIKARVSQKSQIRTWHKQNSEGKLFSVNFLDESGEIKATGFNEQCDALYDKLIEGEVYYISTPCKVALAKKQFSTLPNDYELAFERDTTVSKAEDSGSVPMVNLNAVALSELEKCEKDATVDVCGILKEVGEVQEAIAKASGKPYQRREVQLVDDSGFSVRATLWNKTATEFEAEPESVLALKGCKVSDFGGRSLSLLNSGQMMVNPDINDAHRLKGWWDAGGRSENFASHRDTMGAGGSGGQATGRGDQTICISDVKDKGLGENDEAPDYFTVKATIVYIRQENFCYPACKGEKCSKKVTDVGDGWRCEACNKTWDSPNYRYIMSVNVSDHTGQLWLSCFDDVGRIVMGGMSADELMEIQESGNDERKAALFEAANCKKLSFRCRAKKDNFGEVPRVRYQVMSAVGLDYKMEGHRLADLIKQMSMG